MISLDDLEFNNKAFWIGFIITSFPTSLDEVNKYDLPYADGDRGFWDEDISIQHPLATIELMARDSGCTLFICKDDALVDKFRNGFPLSVDIQMQNKGKFDYDAFE